MNATKNNIGRLVLIAHELMQDYPVRILMGTNYKLIIVTNSIKQLENIERNNKLLLQEVYEHKHVKNNHLKVSGVFRYKE